MKKHFLWLLLVLAAFTTAQAQNAPAAATAKADTAALRAYTGRYKMTSDFFEVLLVKLENGKLIGEAVGQGSGELVPDSSKADLFQIPEHGGTMLFERDATGKVNKLTLTLQGQQMLGMKEEEKK